MENSTCGIMTSHKKKSVSSYNVRKEIENFKGGFITKKKGKQNSISALKGKSFHPFDILILFFFVYKK